MIGWENKLHGETDWWKIVIFSWEDHNAGESVGIFGLL